MRVFSARKLFFPTVLPDYAGSPPETCTATISRLQVQSTILREHKNLSMRFGDPKTRFFRGKLVSFEENAGAMRFQSKPSRFLIDLYQGCIPKNQRHPHHPPTCQTGKPPSVTSAKITPFCPSLARFPYLPDSAVHIQALYRFNLESPERVWPTSPGCMRPTPKTAQNGPKTRFSHASPRVFRFCL